MAAGWQRPDLDVAKLDGSTVILQADVPFLRLPPIVLSVGGRKELAGFYVRLPAVAVDVVFQEFSTFQLPGTVSDL